MIDKIKLSYNTYNLTPKNQVGTSNSIKLKALNADTVSFKSEWYTQETSLQSLTQRVISQFNPPIDKNQLCLSPVTIDMNELSLIINQLNPKITKNLFSNLIKTIENDPLTYDATEKLIWADTFVEVSKVFQNNLEGSSKKMHTLTFVKDLYESALKELGAKLKKDLLPKDSINTERQAAINETLPNNTKSVNSINTALLDMIKDYTNIVKENHFN